MPLPLFLKSIFAWHTSLTWTSTSIHLLLPLQVPPKSLNHATPTAVRTNLLVSPLSSSNLSDLATALHSFQFIVLPITSFLLASTVAMVSPTLLKQTTLPNETSVLVYFPCHTQPYSIRVSGTSKQWIRSYSRLTKKKWVYLSVDSSSAQFDHPTTLYSRSFLSRIWVLLVQRF